MSVWVVVGELGQGKTLMAVSKIQEALWEGRRVATNIDLRLEHLVQPNKPRDVTRLPDFPQVEDFMRLGNGYTGHKRYDESKFGLIVLDELAGYMNARTWSKDKGREDAIRWLRHARKFRWHVILISQDVESLDKQIRSALCEHVVRCFRTDNVGLPIISAFLKACGFKKTGLPRTHVGIVRRGSNPNGLLLDRWFLGPPFGELQAGYDTQQKILGENDGPATMLDHRHAPYLWRPTTPYDQFWWWVGQRLGLPASEAMARHLDHRIGAVMPDLYSYKPRPPTYDEWLASRRGSAPEGAPPSGGGEGEAANAPDVFPEPLAQTA